MTFQSRNFQLQTFQPWTFQPHSSKFMVKKTGVEKFMVEKSGVERRSGLEAWGWEAFQPLPFSIKSNQYHFLTFISLHWSIWSSTKGYTTLVQDTSLTQRGTFLILNFSTRSAAYHHRRCGATVAAVTPPLHTAPNHCCSVLHLTLDQFDSAAKGRSLAQYDNSRIFHMIFIQSFVIQKRWSPKYINVVIFCTSQLDQWIAHQPCVS